MNPECSLLKREPVCAEKIAPVESLKARMAIFMARTRRVDHGTARKMATDLLAMGQVYARIDGHLVPVDR